MAFVEWALPTTRKLQVMPQPQAIKLYGKKMKLKLRGGNKSSPWSFHFQFLLSLVDSENPSRFKCYNILSLLGIRMLDQPYMTDLIEANSMGHEPNLIDIYSASWGPTDDGKTVDGPRNATMRAIVKGVNEVCNSISIYFCSSLSEQNAKNLVRPGSIATASGWVKAKKTRSLY